MNEELHANRKHKDTVFRMLYSDKRAILELYNALNGTDYQNPDDDYHAGKRGLHVHEERRILSSGRKDDPVRAPVHVESEHAPARSALYRAAYGKECG